MCHNTDLSDRRPLVIGRSGSGQLDVAVVIVTYNSQRHVASLAASLPAALGALQWRAIVVDNHSTDESVACARDHGLDVVALDDNIGYAAAINIGVSRLGTADFVLVSNPDVVFQAGCVEALVDGARGAQVGIAVPQMRSPAGALAHSQRHQPSVVRALAVAVLGGVATRLSWAEIVMGSERYLRDGDVDWAVGAVMLISHECLTATGPWDASYFLYAEELDYCERARMAGYRIRYVHRAIAVHEGGGGAFDPRLRAMMTLNRVRQYRRRGSSVGAAAFGVVVLMNELSRGYLLGDRAARAGAKALMFRSARPIEVGLSNRWAPWDADRAYASSRALR